MTLESHEGLYGAEHFNVAVPATNLGEAYTGLGDRVKARALLQRSLTIFERQFGKSHAKLLAPLISMGRLELADNRPKEALEIFERALAISLATRARFGVRPRRINDYREDERQVFPGVLEALWRNGPDEARAARAFEAGQWNTMTSAAMALTALGARAGAGDPALGALTRERQDLAAELLAAEKRQTELLSQSGNRDTAQEQSLRDRLAVIEKRLAALDKELQAKFPRYEDLAKPLPLPVAELRRLLRPNEVAIQYVVAAEATYVWAVSETGLKWLRLPIGEAGLRSLVRSIRCGLDRAEWAGLGRERCLRLLDLPPDTPLGAADPLPFQPDRAHALYSILLAPLADVTAGKHLMIVASGPLTSLPFHVLATEKPAAAGSGAGFERVAWLGRRQPITMLPSIGSLKVLRQFAKTSQAASPFLGVGNPLLTGESGTDRSAWSRQHCDPADAPTPQPRAMEMASLATQNIVRSGVGNVDALRHLVPLPETADELCGVAKFLGVPKEAVLLGADATEARMKSLSASGVLADARVLHMATHGLVAGEAEMFLSANAEPALILTPPDAPSEADDGLLTASEVATLKLDADWVILSACNTAAENHVGAEALSGLARAFFYAGARSLLVSHWAVESDATVKLITRAFQEMAGNPRLTHAEALQRSMLALIEGGGNEAHPAAWAPFVIVGSPGAGPELEAAAKPAANTPAAINTVALQPSARAESRGGDAADLLTPPLPVRGLVPRATPELPPLPARAAISGTVSDAAPADTLPPLPTRGRQSRKPSIVRSQTVPRTQASGAPRAQATAPSSSSARPRKRPSAPATAAAAAADDDDGETWEGANDVFVRPD
jgi:CHAT domain-containing protein